MGNNARIWIKRKDNQSWEDVGKWERIQWTRDHGQIKLAHPNQSSYLYVSPLNTKGHYSLIKLWIDAVSETGLKVSEIFIEISPKSN